MVMTMVDDDLMMMVDSDDVYDPQVHKAVMTIEGVRRVVAVKVRHPGVADIIRRDFQV